MKTQSDYRLYTGMGALLVAKGQLAEAEAAFKQALVLNPKSVELRLGLANFYWSNNRSSESEKLLNEARQLDPSHLLLNRMLALFYIATGRSREAEAPLKALADASTDGASKLQLADYYAALTLARGRRQSPQAPGRAAGYCHRGNPASCRHRVEQQAARYRTKANRRSGYEATPQCRRPDDAVGVASYVARTCRRRSRPAVPP